MNTFYFNTGVTPRTVHNPDFPYEYHKEMGNVIRDGVLLIPFECDAPKNSTLLFICEYPDLPESKLSDVIVREAFPKKAYPRYAYLRTKGE